MPNSSVMPADLAAPTDAQIQSLLDTAVRAPSVLNTQPWHFVIDGATVHLDADRDRQLEALDPDGRELAISCGAALFYFRIAAQHAGWTPDVVRLPDDDSPDRFASVTLRPGPPPRVDDRLFRALSLRRTNRLPFASDLLPPGVLIELAECAATQGAQLHVFDTSARKAALSHLVRKGVLAQSQDAAAVADLRTWLRTSHDPRPDGVRDEFQGTWDRHATMRTPPESVAAYKGRLVREAPAVLVLTTETDDVAAWLAAGQALAHALVVAADRGLAASYANEPIEVAALRDRVSELVDGRKPQILFRVGVPEVEPRTARHRASDVTERAA